jgi:hypothetical protein
VAKATLESLYNVHPDDEQTSNESSVPADPEPSFYLHATGLHDFEDGTRERRYRGKRATITRVTAEYLNCGNPESKIPPGIPVG